MKGAGELRLYVTVTAAPGLNWADTAVSDASGLLSDLSCTPAELVLDLESASGRILEAALRREAPGDARFWVEGRSLSELQAGHPPLVSGAVIVATSPKSSPPHRPKPTGLELTFTVLSGPDTGSIRVLNRGKYAIGRTTEDIHIADPQLSRLHAELTVEPTSIRIEDRGSANGTSIDRRRIESSLISTASQVEMGSSICGLRFSSEFENLSAPIVDPSEPLLVHREPATQRRSVMLLMALLPVAIGVGLAVVTGMWMFLAFSAMSALTMLIPVLGGRKRRRQFKRDLEAANQTDATRRKAATPSVAEILQYTFHQANQHQTIESRPTVARGATASGSVLAGWIRLGVAEQSANVSPDPADRDFVPSLLRDLPVSLNLCVHRHISITGNAQQIFAMVRSLVVQISSWNAASGHRLMFYGPLTDMPLEIRFLPQAALIQAPNELRTAVETAADHGIVLFLARTAALTDELESLLRRETAAGRLTIIGYGEEAPQADIPTVTLLRGSAILKNTGPAVEFVPDLVQPRAFERYCRSKGKLGLTQGAESESRKSPILPKVKALDSLVDTAEGQIRKRWASPDRNTNLEGPIGVGAAGDTSVDLQRDGPHLLLAGTTGSGKSELLRTLILSLCLNHSPRVVNFLLIDFKGGSGLGPLRKLPHSVGLLTDLSAESVERAMASLRAEVRRRESLFAWVEAGDIASYRRMRGPDLEEVPSLVVVIDEFRMLLEEVPAAMDELLRIASLGRSLGLHLVMATQRPQGAISADIRANITTSISLRVQTAMESQDILDTSDAAGISIESPGRAYLKRSGEPAKQFQSASSSMMSSLNEPVRMRLLENLLFDDASSAVDRGVENGEAALKGYIRAAVDAWRAESSRQPRQPVLPDLPEDFDSSMARDRLQSVADQDSAAGIRPGVRLGLLDLPSFQQQSVLYWRPHHDAHLALIGGPRSGVNSTMRNVMAQLLDYRIGDLHLYVLDGDGVLPGLEGDVQVGAYVPGDDIRRATRVIRRLAETVSERLAAAETSSRGSEAVDVDTGDSPSSEPPTLVLAVSGWGRWLSAIRNSPWPWAEEIIQDLVRDGGKVGVTVLVGGDRELVTARMFGNIENRLFLPAGASAESLMAWPRLPAMKRTPGRAYVEGRIALHPGVAQLVGCSGRGWAEHSGSGNRNSDDADLPFRIDALPRVLRPADLPSAAAGPGHILVGVQGDQLEPAIVRLPAGSVYVVLGGSQSGKTTTLEMLARQGPAGRLWIPVTAESLEDESKGRTASENHASLPGGTSGNLPGTIFIDDADRLSPQAQQNLIQLHSKGFGVVMSAALGPSVMSRIPLASAARATGRGMVLMPRSAFDGEFFDTRLDPEPAPPPGRAAIIEGARWQEAQLVQLPAVRDKL
ncbi:MAG TPA: FtsK/SpoIIIE domain-containing protein [Arthrobacter sp.]|nr:FtsK/SpoIIIE domain-containing protein [Arthrobacter sp.]